MDNSKKDDEFKKEIENHLFAIFVVSFDVRKGNMIEWQIPTNFNLEGIEFKAIASGLHLIENDLIFFSKDNLYGLAAFESVRILDSQQRNIRFKSVGFISDSYKFLNNFKSFLSLQAKFQLKNPGNYNSLSILWKEKTISDMSFLEEKITIEKSSISLFNRIFNKNHSVQTVNIY